MNASDSKVPTGLRYDVFETPLGWVGVIATDRGLRRTTLPEPNVEAAMSALGPELQQAVHDPESIAEFRADVRRFLSGEAVDLTGWDVSPVSAGQFFLRAWEACRSIPAGETRTYAWLAGAAGRPRAVRAAGQAMARNPLPLVVPCHRVVGSDGSLHGFGGTFGVSLKERLLSLEKRAASAQA